MKFYKSKSGLYLPDSSWQKSSIERLAKRASVAVFVEMRELKGTKTQENAWAQALNKLEFTDIILTACKINQVLYRHGQLDPLTQLKLSQEILSHELFEILKKVQNDYSLLQDDPYACRPVFMHLQSLNLIKRSYLYHSKIAERRINPPEDMRSLHEFGELLLSVSDFLTPSNHCKDRKSYLPAAMEFLRNSVFVNTPNFNKSLGRYYRLFFELPDKCAPGKFGNQNFAQLFESATGSHLDKFFSIGFGLMSQTVAIDFFGNTKEPNEEFILEPKIYFKDSIVPKELWKPIIGNFGLTEPEMTKLIKDKHSESHSVYELSAISDFPLLECGSGRYVISHFPFLLDKFTNGVLRSILKYLEGPKDRRREFKAWWGQIVQKYVSDLFEQELLPLESLENYSLSLDDSYQTGKGIGSGTDVVLFEKSSGTLCLFEVTASSLQYDTTALNDNWTKFQGDMERIIYGKAKQIQNFITQIKSGKISIRTTLGASFESSQIKTYAPYVVSLNFFPHLSYIWNGFPNEYRTEFDGIYAELNRQTLLNADDIAELKLITIEELEYCCNLQKQGYSFTNLLTSWRQSSSYRGSPLMSYLAQGTKAKVQTLQEADKTRSAEAFSFVTRTLFGQSDE